MPSYRYPRPSLSVDIVVFTVLDTDLKVLLIQRGQQPFRGSWALPGGFVDVSDTGNQGESLEAAAARELTEETGLRINQVYMEQLFTFGRPQRDPRGRVISVAYFALVPPDMAPLAAAGSDAAEVGWLSVGSELATHSLAFDHADIVAKAVDRLRGKVDYCPVAFALVPQAFTIAELRSVYEAIKGHHYDPGNFRRRFKRMQTDGVIEPAPGKRQTGTKPAHVFRFARRSVLLAP